MLRAPARINILGEHVDYVSYLPTASLPFGSHEHEMVMLYRASNDDVVRGASMQQPYAPFNFSLSEGPEERDADQDWDSYLFSRPAPAPDWSNYVKAAVFFARWKHGSRIRRGFQFLIDSTIPPCGGSSSSSALVVLAGAAIREVNQLGYQPDQLARQSSQAEWYLGTRGGALDHTTICLAARGRAVHISHSDRRTESIPLPAGDYRWVTFFSHQADKGREVMLEYNERAAVSRLLIPAILAGINHGLPASIDQIENMIEALPASITLESFAELDPEAGRQCEKAFPALVRECFSRRLKVRDRARHHLGEARRVASALALLRGACGKPAEEVDSAMRELGLIIGASHASLRDLYDVCTPEVDRLVEIIASDPRVYGARLMGGGFGGNVLVLTKTASVQSLIDLVQKHFYGPHGRDGLLEGSVMISTPGDGLSSHPPGLLSHHLS